MDNTVMMEKCHVECAHYHERADIPKSRIFTESCRVDVRITGTDCSLLAVNVHNVLNYSTVYADVILRLYHK